MIYITIETNTSWLPFDFDRIPNRSNLTLGIQGKITLTREKIVHRNHVSFYEIKESLKFISI